MFTTQKNKREILPHTLVILFTFINNLSRSRRLNMSGILEKAKDSANTAKNKTMSAMGIKKENPTVVDELSETCPKLSYQQVRNS